MCHSDAALVLQDARRLIRGRVAQVLYQGRRETAMLGLDCARLQPTTSCFQLCIHRRTYVSMYTSIENAWLAEFDIASISLYAKQIEQPKNQTHSCSGSGIITSPQLLSLVGKL